MRLAELEPGDEMLALPAPFQPRGGGSSSKDAVAGP